MSKRIKLNKEAKQSLLTGITKVYSAVSSTMGPWGRNVLLQKDYGQVASTKDGVTVAKNIVLEDPIENMGATIIKQASSKTVDAAGDGTTTSTVIAYTLGVASLLLTGESQDINVTDVKRGIEDATKEVIKSLKAKSTPISNQEQLKQIATLSANGDEEIGNLVSMALDQVGVDGVVTVEKSRTGETVLEKVEGLQFDRGYKSPYFVTDNNNMSAVLEEPYIMIYDKKISTIKDLLPLLEKVANDNKSILIIAEDIEGEALATMVLNKGRGALKICAVKAPEFGDRRTQFLEDVAILTGATVISSERGHKLSNFDTAWLGKARVATISKDTTTIVDGKGDENKIAERMLHLKTLLENTTTPYEIEKIQARLGKMAGGVAIINVGGLTDIEIEEKKDRVDDALQATKAASEEGISIGAGIALYIAREGIKIDEKASASYKQGQMMVYDACAAPMDKIIENANEDFSKWEGYILAEHSQGNKNAVPKIGSNYETVDAFEAGIIDPTKVIRCALENAVAAATTLLLTECVIHDTEEKKEDSGMNFGM